MICGSGMKSVINACQSIKSGEADMILAGGTENMSNSGFVVPGNTMRNGQKMGDFKVIDHMVCDGLTDAFADYHMGITAENVAEQWGVTREEMDELALNSQTKALAAIEALNGTEIGGRSLRINEARGREDRGDRGGDRDRRPRRNDY
jgi:acetyl-CoA C-acetyltransferase